MFGIPSIFIGPIITILVSVLKRIPLIDKYPKIFAAIFAGSATVISAITGGSNPAADLLTGLSGQIGSLVTTAAAVTATAIAAHEVASPISNAIAGKSATSTNPLQP